jgi:hypothetical protein
MSTQRQTKQAAFEQGFTDRLEMYGVHKGAATKILETGLGPQNTVSGTPGLPPKSQTTPRAMNVAGEEPTRDLQDINQEDPSAVIKPKS